MNLTGPANTSFFSDADCTVPISSIVIDAGTNSNNFYFIHGATGPTNIVAAATSYSSASQGQTVNSAAFVWTGNGGTSSWNNTANWSTGAVPGLSDTAKFNSQCNTNCTVSIDSNVNVGGIRIDAGFTGTITQSAGSPLTMENSFVQNGGTFVGGNSTIEFKGVFSLSGGSFTAPSASLMVHNTWQVFGSPTFNANSSNLVLDHGYNGVTIIPGNVNYHDVTFPATGLCSSWNLNGGNMRVHGDLNIHSTAWCGMVHYLDNGTLTAHGDINVQYWGVLGTAKIIVAGKSGGQTINGAAGTTMVGLEIAAGTNPVTLFGEINVNGDYIYTSSGTFTTTGSTLGISNAATFSPGPVNYNHVTFNDSPGTLDYEMGGATMTILGNLKFDCGIYHGRPLDLLNGTLNVYGSVSSSQYGARAGTVRLMGNSSGQTISGVDQSSMIPVIEIVAGTNNVTLASTFSTAGLKVTSVGTLTTTGSTILFSSPTPMDFIPGNHTYHNITFGDAGGYTFKLDLNGGTLNMNGTLSLQAGGFTGNPHALDNGTIKTSGNIVIFNRGSNGTAIIEMIGKAGGQTITGGSGANLPNLLVNVGANGLSLGGEFSVNHLNFSTGNLNMAGHNLAAQNITLNGRTITKGGGGLYLNGVAQGTGAILGGTVNN